MRISTLTRILLLTFVLFLSSCGGAGGSASSPNVGKDAWWREVVFYEIFVRSFKDTNADGIGDFNGITQNLDYLQELGVGALWLMPIHPSPSYHGYDVINYYAVNYEYGTMDDFKRLLAEAHARDIRIIIDLVINHTSSQHPFFRDARNNPASKYRDWYVWSETSRGSGWHAGEGGFYFGLFCDCMPDLNYNNPQVTAQILNVTDYWLNDIGVDGFRVDAAKHLIEEGDARENTPATHEWYKGFYTTYKEQKPDAYAVGEVFGSGSLVVKSYTGDQLDQIFNFEMSSGFVNSVNGGANSGIISAVKFALQDMPDFNFATFLTNHDQNRSMSVFNGNMGKAKAAATLLLTSPGTPFIYYGEEIGMQGRKPDEDIRLPMQWSAGANAGFSAADPWRAPASDYPQINVAAQDADPASLLNHYRALTKLRAGHEALRNGRIVLLDTGNAGVYGVIRSSGKNIIVILVNLTDAPISDYKLSLNEKLLPNGTTVPTLLLGTGNVNTLSVKKGGFVDYRPLDELSPHGSYIFLVK